MKSHIKKRFYQKIIISSVLAISIYSCSSQVNQGKMDKTINFARIYEYGKMAKYAYAVDDTIKANYPESEILVIRNLPKYQGKYFILKNDSSKNLFISIRGTANIENAIVDAEYEKSKDAKIGIYLHKGFKKATDELYADIKPFITPYHEQNYQFHIAGHSLGGAMAVILMMYLQADQYEVNRVITFGQPKVTNEEGVKKYNNAPLLRVIDEKDIVPLVPPLTLISSIHGTYRHMGPEVILLKDQYFVYLNERLGEEAKVTSFWDNLGNESVSDHHMAHYLERIKPKLKKQTEVPFNERLKYE